MISKHSLYFKVLESKFGLKFEEELVSLNVESITSHEETVFREAVDVEKRADKGKSKIVEEQVIITGIQ
ncbi:hypothetical protein NL520_28640, partial [Klebsiella pneumoniae]|nr:hypothetical protein [Klebsiella pneumoniae]